MQKIVQGLSTFHETGAHSVRPLLAHLAANGQRPQAMLITCADSRIMPEELTQADPGDLFMVRNVGNLVPPADVAGDGVDTSVAAAIDYALIALHVRDIVIMGHSGCGAMEALMKGEAPTDHVHSWLRHGSTSLAQHQQGRIDEPELREVDRLSQVNVLASREILATYPSAKERIERFELTLHAWWFDVANAQVLAFSPRAGRFVAIEEAYDSTASRLRAL